MPIEELTERLGTQTTRRTIVRTGAKLAYAAPLVAASTHLLGGAARAVHETCAEFVGPTFPPGPYVFDPHIGPPFLPAEIGPPGCCTCAPCPTDFGPQVYRPESNVCCPEGTAPDPASGACADAAGVPVALNRVGSMLTPFFVKSDGDEVRNFAQATGGDVAAYARFFHAMLDLGVHLPPSQYEAWFVGLAHTDRHVEQTIAAAERAFQAVAARPA